jgi:hypothetical protein
MSLNDFQPGGSDGDFRRDLEEGAAVWWLYRSYRRSHSRTGPVRFLPRLWVLVAVLATVGLVGSLTGEMAVAGAGWSLAAFTVLCNGMRHII